MKNNILNQKTDDFLSRKLDWSFIQQEMKSKFGQGIYESWIKNINLKKNLLKIAEINEYHVFSPLAENRRPFFREGTFS